MILCCARPGPSQLRWAEPVTMAAVVFILKGEQSAKGCPVFAADLDFVRK